jgi:V8-like Glu-specific endopeptidase
MAIQSYGGGVVQHVYDGTVQYSSRAVQYYKEGELGSSTFSTSPQAPKKAWPEAVLMYERNPQELNPEKVLKRIIPGEDGRSRILNTKDVPYCMHVQLTMISSRKTFGGSGVMVGPHHVLTVGHNVFYHIMNGWADSISVYPALNGKSAPFGKLQVVKAYTFADWTNKNDSNFDMALLILDRSIGKYTGWGGIMSTHDSTLTTQRVSITGYPGDKNLNEMWTMEHIMKSLLTEMFVYEIDTYPGQSGSAIWFTKFGLPMIVGVHASGSYDNYGTRVSHQKFTEFVIRVLSETYKIHKSIQNSFIPPSPLVQPISQLPLSSVATVKSEGTSPGQDEYQRALAIPLIKTNYAARFSLFKAAAEKGYPPAMGKLGDCYFGFGESGVERNFSEAIRWYRLGVEKGDPHSEYQLGYFYLTGYPQKDIQEGIRLITSAVQKGHPDTGNYLRVKNP